MNSSGGVWKLCIAKEKRSVAECRSLADRLQRNNTWWAPTLVVFLDFITTRGSQPHWEASELVGPRAFALYTHFAARLRTFWAGAKLQGNWLQDSAVDKGARAAADTLGFFSVAQQVGLPILASTDVTAAPWHLWTLPAGFSLHTELAIYVAEGLTPLAALQSATLNPAKMLSGTDSLGTIAPGKLADLVLLDANPLADITNTTTIRAVVANGRYYDRAALDRMLSDVQRKKISRRDPLKKAP